MPFHHSLLMRLPQLTRWVALWFALSLGAAMASPLIAPKAVELVCSSAGAMKLVAKSADGTVQQGNYTLDCALCALCTVASAPPRAQQPALHIRRDLAYALQPIPQARVPSRLLTQPPARGPPVRG
jgi:hypothetical protein